MFVVERETARMSAVRRRMIDGVTGSYRLTVSDRVEAVCILHPANVARHPQHRATNKGASTDVAVRRSQ